MDVIAGIFGEKEFAMMSDEAILLLGKLLDDQVATVLLNYLENPKADPVIANRINTLIGDKIARCTFHLKVLESGAIDSISKLDLATLAYSEEDYSKLEEQLTFLKNNKNKLKSYIEPRESKDFKDFVAEIKKLAKDMEGKPKDYNDIVKRLLANKDFFCSAKEKRRATRIGLAVSRSTTWEIALNGIKYLQLCEETGIDNWLRREF